MAVDTAEYKLSTEIFGHTGDVRAVCTFYSEGSEYVVTASRDNTACIWRREKVDYILHKSLPQHQGYVSAVCVIPPGSIGESIRIATGSQDNTILIHSLDPTQREPLERYKGHTGLVSSLIYQHSQLISGSWDSTVRVWKSCSESNVLKAHEPAVWTLSGLYLFDGSKRLLSGGADKIIRLWETDTELCVQEYRGHSDVVRDVKVASADLFLSAANDCTIRQWNIHTGHSLREFFGHEAFVYSISLLPDGFVSCGEDSTVRVWRGTECVQVIQLPCISVWSVACSHHGDIVVGSSDSVARVFTVDSTRSASTQQLTNYHSQVEEFKLSRNKESIDVNTLPKMADALDQPGNKTGDTKVVNNNGNAEVYQWDADSLQWVKIGDAIGQAPTTNREYLGQEYDYLFDIEIDDGGPHMRKLKLPYNKTEDPYLAAERFLQINDIPAWYLDQVAEFIMQNADVQHVSGGVVDPFTGGARYFPGQSDGSEPQIGNGQPIDDPYTGGSRYRPGNAGANSSIGTDRSNGSSAAHHSSGTTSSSEVDSTSHYPITSYQVYTSPSSYVSKIIGKLREFSNSTPDKPMLTDEELTALDAFCVSLTSSNQPEQLSILPLLTRLLHWPDNMIFPVLDITRLAMLNGPCAQSVVTLTFFTQLLHELACGPYAEAKNQLLVLRIIANSFSSVEEWVWSQRKAIFEILTKLVDGATSLGKNQQVSLVAVIVNYSYYCSKCRSSDGVVELVQLIIKMLSLSQINSEATYGTLISLGTLITTHKEIVLSVSSSLHNQLAALLESDTSKVSDCSLLLLGSIPL